MRLKRSKKSRDLTPNEGLRWKSRTEGEADAELEQLKQRRRPGRSTEPWHFVNSNSWHGDLHNTWLGEDKDSSFRPWRDPRRKVWPDDLAALQKLLQDKRRRARRDRIIAEYRSSLPPAGIPNNWQEVLPLGANKVSFRSNGEGKIDRGAEEEDVTQEPDRAAYDGIQKSETGVEARLLYGQYIPRAARSELFVLPKVCPSLPLQLGVGCRIVTIVTTAALPWFTGTAINPLLRAAYLALNHQVLVTLMVPWLELEDQKQVYPKGMTYTRKQDQEEHMRKWLWDRVGLPVHFRIAFYPTVFDLLKFGIFPTQKIDITELIPPSERDVVILEEPEHLSWFNYQGKWRSKFRLSVGVGHTNYMEYLRRQAGEAFPPVIPLMWILNVALVRANCHKVIRLSRGVQWFCDSVVCNVHGVSPNFLEIGDRVRKSTLSQVEEGFSSEDETCSAAVGPDSTSEHSAGAPCSSGTHMHLQHAETAGAREMELECDKKERGMSWEGEQSSDKRDGQAHTAGPVSSSGRAVRVRECRRQEGFQSRSVDSLQTPTSVLQASKDWGLESSAEHQVSGAAKQTPGEAQKRVVKSPFTAGCYFIGRAIWGKGYHELCQLLKKQKDALEGQATGDQVTSASRSPKHRLVKLDDLDGHEIRPGGERIDPEAGALPLVQEPGESHTFRLLNLCMRSRFLWHIQAAWLRTRYGERLRWLEHGRRAFCALQSRGENSLFGSTPLERVHSENGEVKRIIAATRGGEKTGLAELVHVDCYGTGPHEGEIEAFSREHGLPLTFNGRIDHKELVQFKVYVNPAVSDVVCTATAEALAMGKFAVIADHKSNEFFIENFKGNCITFSSDDPDEFLRCLHYALAHEPAPLTPQQRRLLTWEAATERFMQAAGL